jgi:hypothetical protein
MIRFELVVCIVCILCLVWFGWSLPTTTVQTACAPQESSGRFDEPARRRLIEIEAVPVERRTIDQNFDAGRIVEQNVVGDAPTQEMILATTPAVTNVVARDYTAAMQQLIDGHRPIDVNPLFMINHVVDFGERVLDLDYDDEAPLLYMLGMADLAHYNERTRTVEAARDTATNREEFADEVMRVVSVVNSDPQNVHDVGVRLDNQRTLDKIGSGGNRYAVIDEITQHIDGADLTYAQKDAARRVLAEFAKDNVITAYNDTELNIIANVWARADDPANTANRQFIKDAVVKGLADSIGSDGKPVCINGRVSGVIGALATLDADETVGVAVSDEIKTREIYHGCRGVVDAELERAIAAGGDLGASAAEFAAGNPAEMFVGVAKSAVNAYIDKHATQFSPSKLAAIKESAGAVTGLDW